MRLTNLTVDAFMAIQSAKLALGPGLNILYGPNDLGKSTLARAIRAALLVPPGSAEGGQFGPWHADATPAVSLTFVDSSDRYWKVNKNFGDKGAAELRHSKDGLAFAVDCTGRQVEEKLRALLGWGIPGPGGRGATALPKSFLANALLSAQTDVDAILGASLADDKDPSGKLQLTKALATLVFNEDATMDGKDGTPFRVQDGTVTAYLYPVTNGSIQFGTQLHTLPMPNGQDYWQVRHIPTRISRVTWPWSNSDLVGSAHVISYLIVFRPTDQPAPNVSGLVLKEDTGGGSASANVDGADLALTGMR